jgi:hypothetical protein
MENLIFHMSFDNSHLPFKETECVAFLGLLLPLLPAPASCLLTLLRTAHRTRRDGERDLRAPVLCSAAQS